MLPILIVTDGLSYSIISCKRSSNGWNINHASWYQ